MDRVAFGEHLSDQGMSGLVISGVPSLALRHHHALALRAHQNFVFGLLEILHFHRARTASCCHQCRLIAQVGEVGPRHAGRPACDHSRDDVLTQRYFAHVHIENLLAAPDIGQGHVDLSVKTPRAQQGCIKNIGTIGSRHHDHAHIGFEAIHLDQHLIECLLSLVVSTAQASAALTPNGINFVDKDDAGCILLGVVKHVAHARCADANKHFHKVRSADTEKGHLGFTRNPFGEQGFAGTRWANQQQAAGNAAAEFLELGRILQEIDHLLDFLFGLVATSYIGESHLIGIFIKHARLALAKAEGTALATALHLTHEIDPDTDQQEHRAPAHQQRHEQRALFARFDVKLDTIGDQVTDQATIKVGSGGPDFAIIGGDSDDFGTALTFLNDCTLDALASNLLQKIGVTQIAGTGWATGFKLFENGKEHQRNDEPDGNFREPLIIQARLQ